MLEHVAEPGAVALAHAADEAARLAVGAAVLGEPRERRRERVDEGAAEPPGRPRLELAEIQLQPDDRESARTATGRRRRSDRGCAWVLLES